MSQDSIDSLAMQIRRYLEFARRTIRRWWVICLLTLLGAALSSGIVMMITRYYKSQAMISFKVTVDRGSVLTREESQTRDENWLQIKLKETYSSRTLQKKIIDDFGLFPGLRGSPTEVLLEEFTRRISFETVGLDSFKIAFEYTDPQTAQRVAQRLADEFINKNITETLAAANATLTFMKLEVSKARTEMEENERRMAQFVSDHPEYQIDPATGLTRSVLSGGSSAPAATSPELRALLAKKGQLEGRLRMYLNPAGDAKAVEAKQEMERARQRYMALRTKYTARHPDVQRAQQYLAQVTDRYRSSITTQQGSSGTLDRIRSEISEVDRAIARVKRRLDDEQAAEHKPAKARSSADAHLSGKALLEKEYYELSRDRTVVKAKYEQLQDGFLRAKVTSNLERKRAESEFSIVDRANLPQKPSRPDRTKVSLAGTGIGLLIGLGIAVLLVIFDPRIYSEEDLRRATDLPVLAQIVKDS